MSWYLTAHREGALRRSPSEARRGTPATDSVCLPRADGRRPSLHQPRLAFAAGGLTARRPRPPPRRGRRTFSQGSCALRFERAWQRSQGQRPPRSHRVGPGRSSACACSTRWTVPALRCACSWPPPATARRCSPTSGRRSRAAYRSGALFAPSTSMSRLSPWRLPAGPMLSRRAAGSGSASVGDRPRAGRRRPPDG